MPTFAQHEADGRESLSQSVRSEADQYREDGRIAFPMFTRAVIAEK